ncbi:winged helix-turn-helix domain-containing protein [Litoribrevibacter euphylliae]|uniref:Winged helix-turn-helix domain-containing protein n=1 Tax=Litoribrevibacter euphylliae TaxID=1834034 RepID=A0ABV7HKH2_9GAMM
MIVFEGFKFDPKTGRLFQEGSDEPLVVRHKLIQLLAYLLEHQDRVISKDELLNTLWDHGQYREHSLSQSILELRKVLGDSASSPNYIRTVPNQGYQWICSTSEVLDENVSNTFLHERKSQFLIAGLVALSFVVSVVFVLTQPESGSDLNKKTKVLVLPFQNQTQTQSMDWVELGLADMMASDLMLIDGLDVITPAQMRTQLLTEKGEYQTDPQFILSLLKDASIDVAIQGEVQFVNDQQALSYRIISIDDEPISGVIERKDLAVAMPNIVSQLYGKLDPQSSQIELPNYDYVPSAMHEYARGVQALNNEGAILARYYFGASTQIDPNHSWSLAYLGVCQLYLGHWIDAESYFTQAMKQDTDPNLQAFVNYWLASINFRRGDLEQASLQLQQITNQPTKMSETPLARMIDQLTAQIKLLQSDSSNDGVAVVSNEAFIAGLSDIAAIGFVDISTVDIGTFAINTSLVDDESFYDDSAAKIRELKEQVRRLTIKGYKPTLFKALVALVQQSQLTMTERKGYLEQALSVIKELKQPYDHAQVLILAARFGILQEEETDGLRRQINQYLEHAMQIAVELEAGLLLSRVGYYQTLTEINESLVDDPSGAQASLKLFSESIETDPLSIEFSPLVERLFERVDSEPSTER